MRFRCRAPVAGPGRIRRHGRCGAVAGALAGRRKRADGIRSPLGCDSTPDRTGRGTLGGRAGRGAGRRISDRSTRATRAANRDCGGGRAGRHECAVGGLAMMMQAARSSFPSRSSLRQLALAAGAFLTACANVVPPASDIRAAGAVESAFVVIGAGGARVARLITTDDACPAIAVDETTTPMPLRAAPETVAQRPTRSDPADSTPSRFPVRVCDLTLP